MQAVPGQSRRPAARTDHRRRPGRSLPPPRGYHPVLASRCAASPFPAPVWRLCSYGRLRRARPGSASARSIVGRSVTVPDLVGQVGPRRRSGSPTTSACSVEEQAARARYDERIPRHASCSSSRRPARSPSPPRSCGSSSRSGPRRAAGAGPRRAGAPGRGPEAVARVARSSARRPGSGTPALPPGSSRRSPEPETPAAQGRGAYAVLMSRGTPERAS